MFQSLESASIAQSASLYNVCCMVRSTVKDVKPLIPHSLSPASDLMEDNVERLVPVVLYNFIALVIGAIPEAECELLGAKVKVTSERLHRRTLASETFSVKSITLRLQSVSISSNSASERRMTVARMAVKGVTAGCHWCSLEYQGIAVIPNCIAIAQRDK